MKGFGSTLVLTVFQLIFKDITVNKCRTPAMTRKKLQRTIRFNLHEYKSQSENTFDSSVLTRRIKGDDSRLYSMYEKIKKVDLQ